MREIKTLKILLVSLFALCILPSSLSATQDYEPGFEYDYVLYDTELECVVCCGHNWYLIDDQEFNMWIAVCMDCAYWMYWDKNDIN